MQKVLQARFYRTGGTGPEPVREWLRALTRDERKGVGHDIRLAELGWPIGMPLCRPLGEGLFEVRTSLSKRIARVLFCIADGEMWLLHGLSRQRGKRRYGKCNLPGSVCVNF